MDLPPYLYVIAVAIIVGVIRYKRLDPPYIRLFVPFLVLTFVAEGLPALNIIRFRQSNHWWFNIFTVFEFIFYTYIFSRAIPDKRTAILFLYAMPVYTFTALINILFIQGIYRFHTISYRIGAVMIVT
ncbi:MAG TPA: hypothetical protein VM187_11620, partial [Niastella sp.]|nr:hypothetical protein [Niastella sp.]